MPLPPDLEQDLQLAIEAARAAQRVSRPMGVVRRDGTVDPVADLASDQREVRAGRVRAKVVPLKPRSRTR